TRSTPFSPSPPHLHDLSTPVFNLLHFLLVCSHHHSTFPYSPRFLPITSSSLLQLAYQQQSTMVRHNFSWHMFLLSNVVDVKKCRPKNSTLGIHDIFQLVPE
ncbi:hypothetical protein LINPERPRIM_LOCUS30958, partial [Linum perenne]